MVASPASRYCEDSDAGVGLRMFLLEALGDGDELRARGFEGDAGFETADDLGAVVIAALPHELAVDDGFNRHVGVGGAVEAKMGGQDPGDGGGDVVEHHGFSDEVGLTVEEALPSGVRQPSDGRGACTIVVGVEITAEVNADAEDREEILGNLNKGDLLGGAGGFEFGAGGAIDRKSGESILARAPVQEVWIRYAHVGVLAGAFRDVHEPIGVGVGKVAQDGVVDQVENGGVGPDAECEGEDDETGETRRFAEDPERKAEVVHA